MPIIQRYSRLVGMIGAVAAVGLLTACAYPNHRRYHASRAVVIHSVPESSGYGKSAPAAEYPSEMPETSAETNFEGHGEAIAETVPSWKELPSPFDAVRANAANAHGEFVVEPKRENGPPDVFGEGSANVPGSIDTTEPAEVTPPNSGVIVDPTAPAEAPAQPAVLTKQDLLDMAVGGIGEEIIQEMVKASYIKMTLNSQSVIDLHRAGLSPETVLLIVRKITAQEDREALAPGESNARGTTPGQSTPGVSEPVNGNR